MKLRIGSRESRLAVIQSQMVMELIAAAEPEAELELPWRPTPQPSQHWIQAASATYTTAYSNVGSLTH